MTVLEEWRKKESWKNTLPLIPVYVSNRTNEQDIDLASLCNKEKTLTLSSEGGFREVSIASLNGEINESYRHLTSPLSPLKMKKGKIITLLLRKLEAYFTQFWDARAPHLFLHSGGADSRILSWVLTRVREEIDIGEIYFVCQKPEDPMFLSAMKQQGWDEEQYYVHKKDEPLNIEYYGMGRFEDNANSFSRMHLETWGDHIKPEETVLVQGTFGGELLHYPLWKGQTENRYNDLVRDAECPNFSLSREYIKWDDILMPYISYEYLDLVFRIPSKYFEYVAGEGSYDVMRTMMLKRFNDKSPLHYGHAYTFTKTDNWINYIKEKWLSSKFYRDYKDVNCVGFARPWTANPLTSLDAKLYAYATMYETIKRIPEVVIVESVEDRSLKLERRNAMPDIGGLI